MYLGEQPTGVPALAPPAGSTPAVNVLAAWVLAAYANGGWNIAQIWWSYSAAPAAGSALTITCDGVVETYYISSGGPGVLSFHPPKQFPTNKAVTIGLSAGGSGIFGSIPSVSAWNTING